MSYIKIIGCFRKGAWLLQSVSFDAMFAIVRRSRVLLQGKKRLLFPAKL